MSTSTTSEPAEGAEQKVDRAFERWRKSAAWMTGMGLSNEEVEARKQQKAIELEEAQWVRCERWKADLMRNSMRLYTYDSFFR